VLALAALLAAAMAVGCGADDEPATGREPTVPDLTVPQTDEPAPSVPETETETTAPPTTETTAPPTSGGTPAPKPPQTDTPENDTPPPSGSPAERFEDFCNDNPGACG
jgi:hypothetical protein